MRIGYHADGMNWDRYLRLTHGDRFLFHEALTDLIEQVDDEGEGGIPARPKQQRK
jgi:hypothetical protein